VVQAKRASFPKEPLPNAEGARLSFALQVCQCWFAFIPLGTFDLMEYMTNTPVSLPHCALQL
jgi:hypothetical protein